MSQNLGTLYGGCDEINDGTQLDMVCRPVLDSSLRKIIYVLVSHHRRHEACRRAPGRGFILELFDDFSKIM